MVTQHGTDLSHDPPSHCLPSQVPALCDGESPFWQFQGGTRKKQGVCLSLLRNPFSTILGPEFMAHLRSVIT